MIRGILPAVVAPLKSSNVGEWIFQAEQVPIRLPNTRDRRGPCERGKFSSSSDKYSQQRRGKLNGARRRISAATMHR